MQFSISKRPTKLSDLFGLEDVKKEFYKRAKTKNWPNAVLLKGLYGAGKTTVAHIISAMMQCENPSSIGDPCGVCPACKSIFDEKFDRNTSQLDGGVAGKDDMVDLITKQARTKPLYDNRQICIIEETDQLSDKAKNTLLKVLESPNKHTTFILLSMVQGGISPALASRCQKFNFKPHTTSDIMYYLKNVLESENLWEDESIPKDFKFKGLSIIAQSADGSMREAVQLLEKCLNGEYWTENQILDNLGIQSEANTVESIKLILNKDNKAWEHLYKLEPTDFFFLSFKIVSDAMVYKASGYSADERFTANIASIANHPNFPVLFNTMMTLNQLSRTYLKKTDIIANIADYWKQTNSQKLSEETPKVRTRGDINK